MAAGGLAGLNLAHFTGGAMSAIPPQLPVHHDPPMSTSEVEAIADKRITRRIMFVGAPLGVVIAILAWFGVDGIIKDIFREHLENRMASAALQHTEALRIGKLRTLVMANYGESVRVVHEEALAFSEALRQALRDDRFKLSDQERRDISQIVTTLDAAGSGTEFSALWDMLKFVDKLMPDRLRSEHAFYPDYLITRYTRVGMVQQNELVPSPIQDGTFGGLLLEIRLRTLAATAWSGSMNDLNSALYGAGLGGIEASQESLAVVELWKRDFLPKQRHAIELETQFMERGQFLLFNSNRDVYIRDLR